MAAATKGTKSTAKSSARKSATNAAKKSSARKAAVKVHNRTGQPGATGPAYTPQQIAKGVKLVKAGKLNAREVASACGVKSQSYFRKTCLAQIAAETTSARKPAAKKATGAKKSATKK